MAFFSFGKKDKNPPQSAESVAKTPPATPPKIQTPPPDAADPGALKPKPPSGVMPTIKPPQPSGLMPAVGIPKNTVTTQPMSMPARPVAPPVAPNQKPRATQRLVVGPNMAGKMTASRSLVPPAASGAAVNLPVGMILRCLPPEMLSASLAEFEASGAAATEIPIPINSILNQLPSGKVELPVRDLIANVPPGFLKSPGEIASSLSILASLPLMDVVMRIPPDLLAVRSDQKDIDPNVRRMADPFSEDTMRQAAPKPTEAKIVDESQVPSTEEFVPQASTPTRSFVPPPRTVAPAAPPLLQQTSSLSGRPMLRATAPMPGRILPAAEGNPVPPRPPQLSASQMLGVPRPAVAPPTVTPQPPYGATTTGPLTPKASPELPAVPQIPPVAPPASTTSPQASATVLPPAPDANAGELQRLAALAMAEIETQPVAEKQEEKTEENSTTVPSAPEPEKPAAAAIPDFPNLKQFTFNSPAPVPVEKTEPGIAATSRLTLPEYPIRELTQTAPIATPAPAEPIRAAPAPVAPPEPIRAAPNPEPAPSPARTAPPVPSSSFLTESQILPQSAATAVNLNNCSAEDLLPIPGMSRPLAAAIVQHRDKIGEFHKLEELLDVPGMTPEAYSNLTGETPSSGGHPTINELLGFPLDRELSLKDITDRIVCWPDVTGCLLSQKNGLHLVGTAPDFLDMEAIVAFAPRMFEDVNKSFIEITGKQTDELIIPTTGTSFHLLREKDLYLIILSRLPQMPERHLKIARFVLAGLSARPS